MRDSGYPESTRYQVVQSGLQGYEKMVEVERAGGRPVKRPQKPDQTDRKKQKTRKKDHWYKNGTYSTVPFVPCTLGSILANEQKEVETRSAWCSARFSVRTNYLLLVHIAYLQNYDLCCLSCVCRQLNTLWIFYSQ